MAFPEPYHLSGGYLDAGNLLHVRIPRHDPAIVLEAHLIGRFFPSLLEPRFFGGGGIGGMGLARRGARVLDLGRFLGIVQSSMLPGLFVNIAATIPPRAMFELVTALAAGPMAAGLGGMGVGGGMGVFGMDHGIAVFLRQMLDVREHHHRYQNQHGRVIFESLLAHYASLMIIAHLCESPILMTFLEEFFMHNCHTIACEESVEGLVEWSRYLMHSPFPRSSIASCLRQLLHARRTTCTEVRNLFSTRRDCQTEEVLMQLDEYDEQTAPGMSPIMPRGSLLQPFDAVGRRSSRMVHFEDEDCCSMGRNGGCRSCGQLVGQCCRGRRSRHSAMQSTLMAPLLSSNSMSGPLMLRGGYGGFSSGLALGSGYRSTFGGFGPWL